MDFAEILIKNGAFGVTTLIFMTLYLQERKDNKELHSARLRDLKEFQDKLSEPLALMNRTVGLIYDKLQDAGKGVK